MVALVVDKKKEVVGEGKECYEKLCASRAYILGAAACPFEASFEARERVIGS